MSLDGRVQPNFGSDSLPETCHSGAFRGKNSECAGKDGLWPSSATQLPQMACIRLWPFMGLSAYIVWQHRASKPVSHMSRTMTSFSGSFGSLNRFSRDFFAAWVYRCGCSSGLSADEAVITILIAPSAGSALCHSGRRGG
jgi:hypothetical protein